MPVRSEPSMPRGLYPVGWPHACSGDCPRHHSRVARGNGTAPHSEYWAVRAGRYQAFTTVDAQASIAAGREVTRSFAGTWLNIPRHSLGAAATYAARMAGFDWRTQLSYSLRDRQEASRVIFSPEYDVAPYTLVNASVLVQRAGSPWSVQLFGRNITDERYELTRNFFINAQVTALGQPATMGLRVRYER